MSEQVAAQDKPKERLVEQMPGNVLDHGGVPREHTLGIDHLIAKGYQNMFLDGSVTWFASTVPFMSQRQSVWSSLAESRCPFMFGFQDRPYLYGRFNHLTS